MIVAFALRSVWKKLRVFTSVLVLAFILFYLLPKLFCLLWHGDQFEEQIRDDPLPGKPLRVFQSYNRGSV